MERKKNIRRSMEQGEVVPETPIETEEGKQRGGDLSRQEDKDVAERERDNKGCVVQDTNDVEKKKEKAPVNLSESELKSPKQKLELRHKKMFYSDSNLMNDALVGKQVESFKVKLKERQSEKTWAHLTTANLQTLTKSQEPTSRQHSFQRIRKWVQDSAPPYDANPSPGVPSLASAPPLHQPCWVCRFFGCFQ